MPSGRTHDRITLWALPWIAGLAFWQTRSSNITLLIAGGFLFGGLMFGPDLDIYSRHYQRWGWFRWIWLPYQKSLRHRSFLSHGPIIGTTLRVIYLCCVVGSFTLLMLLIIQKLLNLQWNWQITGESMGRSLIFYATEFMALFLGMELGAMSHSLSDWSGSAYKRFKKKGIAGVLPSGKIKKRKVSSRMTRQTKRSRSRKSVKTAENKKI
ncbi:metal-binding protein [Calothrix rhizosoleniae]|uniref:metal-binding protein n=1 Tax=Calothrix rhizosoleniae TaxID=888997 RepID=UPI000B4A4C94|nr:metal-binding protein [Calothrix rhizosoleniae]